MWVWLYMETHLYGEVPLIPRIECLDLYLEVSALRDFWYSVYPVLTDCGP
jgi:hypothetical protein